MAESIPNVPLEYCEKLTAELKRAAAKVDPNNSGYTGESIIKLLDAITVRTTKLARYIQEDQSGEI